VALAVGQDRHTGPSLIADEAARFTGTECGLGTLYHGFSTCLQVVNSPPSSGSLSEQCGSAVGNTRASCLLSKDSMGSAMDCIMVTAVWIIRGVLLAFVVIYCAKKRVNEWWGRLAHGTYHMAETTIVIHLQGKKVRPLHSHLHSHVVTYFRRSPSRPHVLMFIHRRSRCESDLLRSDSGCIPSIDAYYSLASIKPDCKTK
jgi:hypothetical protein